MIGSVAAVPTTREVLSAVVIRPAFSAPAAPDVKVSVSPVPIWKIGTSVPPESVVPFSTTTASTRSADVSTVRLDAVEFNVPFVSSSPLPACWITAVPSALAVPPVIGNEMTGNAPGMLIEAVPSATTPRPAAVNADAEVSVSVVAFPGRMGAAWAGSVALATTKPMAAKRAICMAAALSSGRAKT
jgi:hypothetical protein